MVFDTLKRWFDVGQKTTLSDLKKDAEYAEQLDNTEVKGAVIGASGVGKSSLLIGITGDDTIERGSTETTKDATTYVCARNKNLIFDDLPGFGTQNHPEETYFTDHNLNQYDYFILVFSERVRANDVALFKQLKSVGKAVFIVRNKIDLAIDSERFDNGLSEEETLQKIHAYIATEFDTNKEANDPVFLVSARHIDRWDFGKLLDAIEGSLHGLKREKFMLEANAISAEQIKKKRPIVNKYIKSTAAASALNGLNPIPGLDIGVDVSLLMKLSAKISDCYNISETDLSRLERNHPELKQSKKYQATKTSALKLVIAHATKEGIVLILKKLGKRYAGKTIAKYIPVIGQVTSAGLGYYLAHDFGKKYANKAEDFAVEITEIQQQIELKH